LGHKGQQATLGFSNGFLSGYRGRILLLLLLGTVIEVPILLLSGHSTSTAMPLASAPAALLLLLQDMFGHVRSDERPRGLYYLFYAYNGIAGGAVLAALVAGDGAGV